MLKLMLSSVALAALSVGAVAADLPRRDMAPAPAPVYQVPLFTWSGFYVGLNAGVAFGGGRDNGGLRAFDSGLVNNDQVNRVDFIDRVNSEAGLLGRRDERNTGFTGGVQAGYNWQFGSIVAGIEADINYRGNGGNNDGLGRVELNTEDGRALTYSAGRRSSNWFATLRPRVGVAFDRTLLYVTGGLAYGGGSNRGDSVTLWNTDNNPETVIATWGDTRRSGSDWGWTLGGGVEHAFSNNWTAKIEYLYVDLDRGGNGALYTDSGRLRQVAFTSAGNEDKFHVVRVGLNYKFGGPAYQASPVLARY